MTTDSLRLDRVPEHESLALPQDVTSRGVRGSSRRLRIVHIFGRMNRGGAELRTLEILRHVDPAAFRMEFVSLSGLPGLLDEEIRACGGEVHLCSLGPTFPWSFSRLLRAHRFDVVHSHVHYFSGYILRLAAQAGIPQRIAHFRSTSDGHRASLRRSLQRVLMRRWIDRYATHILAVSRGAMAAAWGPAWESDARCRVVFNGLDVSAFSRSPDRDGVLREFGQATAGPLWIHVGRIDRAKNHERLLALFAAFLRRDPSARCLLVGSGDVELERSLRAKSEALGIGGMVSWAGNRADVPGLLQAADLMVYPSVYEGLPGAVLEACAAGTPVLGSDIPGIREIAAHFSLVRCLPLAADDSRWVGCAEELLAGRSSRSAASRQAALAAFAASPFALPHCQRELCRIWEGETRRRF